MLKQWILCGSSLALTALFSLFQPDFWLLPALVAAVLLPYLCIRLNRKGFAMPGWTVFPESITPSAVKAVAIEPALLIGKTQISAEVWLPFEHVEAEHFRSRSGAMLLAAAIAQTDACIAAAGSTSGCTPEEIRQWEQALGIVPDTFRTLNPKVDDAKANGFSGVVVRDGKEYRAYFVGGPAIIRTCKTILDGTERPMQDVDLQRLGQTPAGALCYASSPVVDGKLTGLCYLGAVRPVIRSRPSAEAIRAGERLQEMGLSVRLMTDKRWDLQVVREMGIEWPDDEGTSDTLEVHADPEAGDRDFSKPVIRMLGHANCQVYGQLLAALMGFCLWPCSLSTSSPWALLGGLVCLCVSILLCHDRPIADPPAYRLRSFLFPLLPGILIPVASMLLLERFAPSRETSGTFMILAEALAYALYWLLYGTEGRKKAYVYFVGIAVCVLCMLLSYVLIAGFDLVSLCCGLIVGSLTSAVILVLHRYLCQDTPEDEAGEP